MKIKRLIIRECDIPLRVGFRQSTNERTRSNGIIVEINTENEIIGYGECLPRDYVTGETQVTVIEHIDALSEILLNTQFETISDIKKWLDHYTAKLNSEFIHASCSRCALELSLLDAFGKEIGLSLSKMIGIQKIRPIQYSGVVAGKDQSLNERIIDFLYQLNISKIKIKIGWDLNRDLKLIDTVRSRFGPDVEIRVDINGAWSLNEAIKNITVLSQAGVKNFEQPLQPKERDHYIDLVNEIPSKISIWTDESVCNLKGAKWFINNKAAHGINLKISKNGGLFNCMEIASYAHENGFKLQLGSQVGETSLLAAAGYLLAVKEDNFIFHEGAFGSYLMEFDITENEYLFGPEGRLHKPSILDIPGLGVKINPNAVENLKPLKRYSR